MVARPAARRTGEPVNLLVGLSVIRQAAAVAAVHAPVRRLLLVSATVPPGRRSLPRLFAAWARADGHLDSPLLGQVPDWAHAGPRRLLRGFVSAAHVDLKDVLTRTDAALTIVSPDHDNLGSLDFAAALCQANDGRLVVMPDGPHSWPIRDDERFVALVEELLAQPGAGPARA